MLGKPEWCNWDKLSRGGAYLTVSVGATAVFVFVLAVKRMRRKGFYLTLSAIFTGLSTAIFGYCGVERAYPAYCAMTAAFYVYMYRLMFCKGPPGFLTRAVVSTPAVIIFSASLFGLPMIPFLGWVPPVVHNTLLLTLAVVGVVQSSVCTRPGENVHVCLGKQHSEKPQRIPSSDPPQSPRSAPFTVFQLTDVHLGSFMPVSRLRRICERALERKPDIVVLTGDYLTREIGTVLTGGSSENVAEMIRDGLQPLRDAMPGRVFAGIGNHDYEDLAGVMDGFTRAGIPLLADGLPGMKESAVASLPCGRQVQVIGSRFVFRGSTESQLTSLLERNPRPAGCCASLLLLHNPSHFVCLPRDNHVDLSLSGHYHGGQVGLLSLGINVTMLSMVSKLSKKLLPDNGLWARGSDLCYSHRGTGLYGFPVRVGVPSEESMLHVYPAV
eukprot:TRINITY_DN13489_c0_g1_i1.p1 TRINITY_DN13489_c0_g1~~TRINITY_DN13489_c0_g1_i1.p1  ORF type:complete len:440 (+),score=83.47 TRINITY_DN13489_c0_g1_i1:85-1404(+)